jgi:transposase
LLPSQKTPIYLGKEVFQFLRAKYLAAYTQAAKRVNRGRGTGVDGIASYNRAYQGGVRMPLPPPLTEEQRREALKKAAEARKKRAELKEQLKSGRTTLRELLERTSDGVVGKMKVSTVLESLPGVGRVRARKLMERLDISESRRMRGLGAKQKEALLTEFSRR